MANGKAIVPYQPPQPPANYPSYQPPIIYQMGGSGKSSGNTALTLGIVAITLVGGGLALWWVFKGKAARGTNSADIELAVESLQTTVAAGSPVKVSVSVTNISDKAIHPSLQFSIKHGTSGSVTVNDTSPFVDFGEIEPDDVVTKEMAYIVPGNWAGGWEIYGRLVLDGTRGTVYNELIATVSGAPGPNPSLGQLEIQSVEAINKYVSQNEKPGVTIVVVNKTGLALTKNFRLDIRTTANYAEPDHLLDPWPPGQTTIVTKWLSGYWNPLSLLPTTAPQEFEIYSNPMPSAYYSVAEDAVAAKIIIQGDEGNAWGQTDLVGSQAFQIFQPATSEAQAHLTITSRGAAGLVKKCVPKGTKFQYTVAYNNNSGANVTATFVLGFRDQGAVTWYQNQRTPKTLAPGAGNVTFESPSTTAYDGAVLDIRALISEKATVVTTQDDAEVSVTPDQGTVETEQGEMTAKIWEADQCAYVGDSKIIPLKDDTGNTYLAVAGTRIPSDGRVTNGQPMGVSLRVTHVGPAKSYRFGLFVKTNVGTATSNGSQGFWIPSASGVVVTIPEHTKPTDFTQPVVGNAIIPASLGSGRQIRTYAVCCPSTMALDNPIASPGIGDPDDMFAVK